ncbi:uncharacterized protein LOC134713843 [Mytilus trossulus]|uniref:uncharacterized protein LOC134713843 n=1 Tax=Mytilus trossulus TaxID=6551 RepID=UPI0030077C68
MDSLMSQDFYTTLYTSLEGSNTFAEFRIKFGGALRHNYFSCCRFDDIIFVGSYVIFRMFLVSAGTYNYSSCTSDILTNIYLITDGVLSVFVFPVLVLHWKERVGGCVNGSSKVDPGTFWYFVLVVRIMSSTLGAVMLYYNVNRIPEFKCQVGYYLSFTTIILEWSFLLLAILLPLMLYSIAYFCAPAYNTHSRLDGNDN